MTLTEQWVERTYECLKVAYDAGINFFDTAEGYEGGKSETIMGKAIKKFGWKQQDLVISTKVLSASLDFPSGQRVVRSWMLIQPTDLLGCSKRQS